ncbi:MAG: hypothetical protein KDD56_04000 [Bdellovibrionales bacterium]|nr:hypothetical protein [Bdellovibrionales bacterium]
MKKKINLSLEESLRSMMISIENQIQREMQRTPAEKDILGVDRWPPIQTRVERITEYALKLISQTDSQIDSLLVLSQAFTKALSLYVQELGNDGLGKIRSSYCNSALELISRDCFLASKHLNPSQELN